MIKNFCVLALVSATPLFGRAQIAHAQDITPPKVFSTAGAGVNLSDGSFTFSETDIAIGPLKLERYQLGGLKDPNDPYFGKHMSHNFDIYVAPNMRTTCDIFCTTSKRPIVHLGAAASGSYRENVYPPISILNANWDSYSGDLKYNVSGAYEYTDQSGSVYTFSTTVTASGVANSRRVSNIVFSNGRRQDFLYSGSTLKAVTDSSGYAIVFDYGSNGLVSAACGYNTASTFVSVSSTCTNAVLKVSYGYSGTLLTSVTDARGGVTTYGYSTRITCVTPPGYSGCKISNTYGSSGAPWMVTQQNLADGSVWKFQYSGDYTTTRDPEAYVEFEPETQVVVTDPANKTSTYSFVQTSPYSSTDANGRTTNYRFEGGWDFFLQPDSSQKHGSSLIEVTMPEGNKYTASYGIRRMPVEERLIAKPGSGSPDLVKAYGYASDCATLPNTPQNCAKPLWIKDAKGNQTDFTYASWGGTLSEMQPAPTSGVARPLKLHTYVQKYAYVKNSGGSLVASVAPVWVPSTETLCQTYAGSSTATCDPAAPVITTSYEYGADFTANNLLVRGAVVSSEGANLRTCYGYDDYGNKIFETKPDSGLASCS